MGKSAPSPPPAPDPAKTAAAQAAANKETAILQSQLNNVNQYTPWGNVTFAENPNAKSGSRWSMNVALSPEQQQLYNMTTAGQKTYGQSALNLLGQMSDTLSHPISTNYDTYRQQAIDAGRARLDPMFAQQDESMRARLLNSGIAEGSDAWNNAFRPVNEAKNDAYLQLLTQGGNLAGQAMQQDIGLRQEPLNEAQALLTGQQVHAPSFTPTTQTSVAPTDVIGAYNNAFNAQMAGYNAQVAQNSATMGGLFGLGGTILGSALRFSDERLKTGIVRIGTADNGLPIYLFRYKAGGGVQMGVMAQDVLKVNPDAVVTMPSGYFAVDYEKALVHG